MPNLQIRTGGQSGVDRAALDACLASAVEYVGWCPRDGWAEDCPDPPGILVLYPNLVPTPSADPDQRTAWNVRDSNAVLIITPDSHASGSPGTAFGKKCAELIFIRPCYTVELSAHDPVTIAATWVTTRMGEAEDHTFVLGIAGPRESEAPGVYHVAYDFIIQLLAVVR